MLWTGLTHVLKTRNFNYGRRRKRRRRRERRAARMREEQARIDAENRAREDAARYAAQIAQQQAAADAQMKAMQQKSEKQQAAVEQTMANNMAAMSGEPTTIKRRKRSARGAGKRGMDKLRIAMSQQGSSTNLG